MTFEEFNRIQSISPEKAHAALFEEYYRYVKAIVFSRLRSFSDEDIEECISDIFADIFFSFSKGSYAGDIKVFIGTVARNKSIDHFRKHSRNAGKTVYLEDDSTPDIRSGEDIAGENEKKELSLILMDCINSLGEPDSSIIIKKFYYDMDSKQIAGELSMKPSAVRVRCSRAASKLKELLAARGFIEGIL